MSDLPFSIGNYFFNDSQGNNPPVSRVRIPGIVVGQSLVA